MAKRPVVLTILDGWGYSPETRGNAVYLAKTPTFDMLQRTFPHTLIQTSGEAVGLPAGQMGNSEVGHLNIGAGRVIRMDVTRIDLLVLTGEIYQDPVLRSLMAAARGRRLHLLGLVSDGGVHSYNTHLYALLAMAKREGVTDVAVHAFMDGRDTPPHSGLGYMQELEAKIAEIGVGRVATVTGRYYAMDRDKRWERVEQAFRTVVLGQGEKAPDAVTAVKQSYERGTTDEFVVPTVVGDGAPIRDGDAVMFFNYRADRGRELTQAIMDPSFEPISRSLAPKNLHYVTMTQYDKNFAAWGVQHVIPVETPQNILGVTFFFNGGIEKPFSTEERAMVASPKVATYDLAPEMSAQGVCDIVKKGLTDNTFDVIVVNFANPDMVGHSGQLEPAIRACEKVDDCLSQIWPLIQQRNAAWIVTADHGNAETMIDPVTGGPHTYHTTNPVPFILASDGRQPLRAGGSLRDIAPTVLGLLGVEKSAEMTGIDLRVL